MGVLLPNVVTRERISPEDYGVTRTRSDTCDDCVMVRKTPTNSPTSWPMIHRSRKSTAQKPSPTG
jgi:hypothetical protein